MKKSLRIVIVSEEGGQFFYYKRTIEELLKSGHSISFLIGKREDRERVLQALNKLKRAHPDFEAGQAIYAHSFLNMALVKRQFATYRHLLRSLGSSRFYTRRVIIYLPYFLRFSVRHNLFYINSFIKSGIFGKWLEYVEEKIPPDKNIITQLRDLHTDVLITSTGDLSSSSPEIDYLKSAKAIGIPSVLSVMGWDHLYIKVSIQMMPDVLLVWNKIQAEDAEKNHGVPRNNIKVVGAAFFDQWFDARKPSLREEFCACNDLDPKKPILTYLSSSGIFGEEIEHLKKIYKAVEGLGIQLVVRPYPSDMKKRIYKRRDRFYKSPESAGIIKLVPLRASRPNTEADAQLFYDTIYHSFAYIGIGNTGMIDGLLIGRPGITLLDDHYDEIQSKSPHFRHLLLAGALHTAKDVESLRRIIKDLQIGKDSLESKRRDFIKEYLRPMGIKFPVAQLIADEIENLPK